MAVKPEKIKAVANLKMQLSEARGAVLVDFRGITVAQDTKLRRKMRDAGVHYRVSKNSMTSIAAREIGIEGIDEYLKGPIAIAISTKDPVAPAKVLTQFSKENRILEIKAGILNGKMISAEGVKALADLPPRDVLLARMLGAMQSPMSGLVNVLQGNIRNLVYALEAVRKQKESA